jgi:aminoglycoside 2'-N-acetyltransferase I
VLTNPAYRGRGHGRRVVAAATALIRRSDADIGLFKCPPERKNFYAAHGWIPMERVVLLGGPRSAPYPTEELVMMDFYSEKGKRGRAAFESIPIFFDDHLW